MLMKNNTLLSIIVNTYNCESYLKQCLESIKNQLSIESELIVVDDSSTDNTFKIIENELYNLSNCSYYSINHSGISSSRNFGIEKAKGTYIMFVDGDDYIIEDTLHKIINYLKLNYFDLTLFNTIKYFNSKNYFEIEKFSLQEGQFLSEQDLINNKICARPWRFIYKRDMIKNNSILFPENLVYEDEEWLPKVIYYSKYIKFLNEYVYVYRKRKGSITDKKDIIYTMNLASVIERTYNWSLNCTCKKKYIYFSLSRCIRNVLDSLNDYELTEDKKLIFDWYERNMDIIMDILEYNKKLKYSINVLGPSNGVKVYKKIFREKYSITKEKVSNVKNIEIFGGKR